MVDQVIVIPVGDRNHSGDIEVKISGGTSVSGLIASENRIHDHTAVKDGNRITV